MILKVKTASPNGWKMYGGVTEINYHLSPLDKMEPLECDGRFVSNKHSRQIMCEDGKQTKKIPAVIVCTFGQEKFERREQRLNNGKMVIFNGPAYLLSDEGKTIERI